MSTFAQRIARNVKPTLPAVRIERASADVINGVAKVLFTTNIPAHRADMVVANKDEMNRAFSSVLGDTAHLVTASIHKAEKPGYYYGFIKTNQKSVAHEDAVKDGSGYSLVAANCFADANDDIWEVREDASGKKILFRNSQEDLTALFSSIAPPESMSVAAASMPMAGKLEFASLVTFLDPLTETYHEGVVLDTATVYDAVDKKAKEINPATIIASATIPAEVGRDLSARMGDDTSTFAELADTNVRSLYEYLEILYGRMPAFLAAYKKAIRDMLDMNPA